MYVQDYDETLPMADWGNNCTAPPYTVFASGTKGAGADCPRWADLFQPYVKNTAIMRCPSDGTQPVVAGLPLSYGVNYYFYRTPAGFRGNSSGGTLAEIQSPAGKIYVAELPASANQELVRPDRMCPNAVCARPPHREGSTYLYVDGHARWHKTPAWTTAATWSDATSAQNSPYAQWVPWVDAPEAW